MSKIIREEKVAIETIQEVLNSSGFEVKKDRGEALYIRDPFSFGAWCRVVPEPKWLNWTTYWPLRAGADEAQAAELAHRCNKYAPVLAFYVEGGRLCASAYQYYAGGIASKSVCRMAKSFGAIFEKTARDFDTDQLLQADEAEAERIVH